MASWTTIRTLVAQAAEAAVPLAGVFVDLTDGTGRSEPSYIELRSGALTGATAATLTLWRISDTATIDKVGSFPILAADAAAPLPGVFDGRGSKYWVTVAAASGGTSLVTATVQARPVSEPSGSSTIEASVTGGAGDASAANQVAGNNTLVTIDGRVDGLEANAATIIGHIDALEGTSATTASNTTSLDGKFPAAAVPADGAANTAVSVIMARLRTWNGTTWDSVKSGLSGIISTLVGHPNVLPVVQYLATRPTLADTNATILQANARGDLATAEQFRLAGEDTANDVLKTSPKAISTAADAWTNQNVTTKFGIGAPVVTKNSPGRVRRVSWTNSNATTGYWGILLNKASAAAASDAGLLDAIWVPQASATTAGCAVMDFGESGIYASTGIACAASSTANLVTFIGAADMNVHVMFS